MRFAKRLIDHRVNGFDMLPGSHFRKYPTELGMQVNLRGYHTRMDNPTVFHNRGSSFVARTLDPEYPRWRGVQLGIRFG
jgi:hypothetical protein